MILKNNDLKKIYLDQILSGRISSESKCPSIDGIMLALRSPSKKTRKIIDHIADCRKCYPTFIFLKEIAQKENDMIEVIKKRILSPAALAPQIKRMSLHPFILKLLPYSAVTILGSIIAFLLCYLLCHGLR